MDLAHFREQLHSYLGVAEKNQKALAALLVMHPNVLSRKLNHTNNAKFTRNEARQLILVLAQWRCFTYRSEIDQFLELLDFNSLNLFTEKEWLLPPLNLIEKNLPQVTLSPRLTVDQRLSSGRESGTIASAVTSTSLKPPAPLTPLPNNLPQTLPGLVGRELEVTEIEELLTRSDTPPLLTLTGPGGCGKTRLALTVAQKLLTHSRFTEGIYFIRLENITGQNELLNELVNALNLKELDSNTQLETLRTHLAKQPHLLILDNFEQLVEAGPVLVDLLKSLPQSKFLVTSRVPLQLSLEQEFHLAPLSLPPLKLKEIWTEKDLERVKGYPAIALFILRAQAVKPNFSLSIQNVAAVVEICRKVDGLPLALELAAARIRTFNPAELLERLNLKLLSGGARDLATRQQTLQGTIEWSYSLLPPEEQALFARLSIFVGGFTLQAAEVVCNSGDEFSLSIETLEGVNSLLVKNLLRCWEDKRGSTRFGMLQTILEYGQEKLRERGEYEQLAKYYAEYYINLAKEKEVQLRGGKQRDALEILDIEYDNLRSVLSRAVGQGPAFAAITLELASSLGEFWHLRGYLYDGRKYLEQALSLTQENENSVVKSSQAKALNILGTISWRQGDHQLARGYFEASLELSRASQDKSEMAYALNKFNDFAADQGDFALSSRYLEETLSIAEECEDKRVIVTALHDRATLSLFHVEDYEQALRLMHQSLALAQKIGDRRGTIFGLNGLGHIAMYFREDTTTALHYFEEGLALSTEIVDTRCIWYSLFSLGILAFNQDNYKEAAEYFEKGLAVSREIGDRRSIYWCLRGLARVALGSGENNKAHKYLEESQTLSRELGVVLNMDKLYKKKDNLNFSW